MFICSTKFKGIRTNTYKLILYEFIIEKNEKFSIKKKCRIQGNYSLITNSSIIFHCFLISSNDRTNYLIKINDDKITLCSEYQFGNKYSKKKNVPCEKIELNLFN